MSEALAVPTQAELIEARRQGTLGAVVESVLGVLCDQPLRYLHCVAGSMIGVEFGDEILSPPKEVRDDMEPRIRARIDRRNATPRPRYTLHVSCPFRLDSPAGPFLGTQDIYREAESPHEWIESDEEDFAGCLFDRRAKGALEGPPLIVKSVTADRGGGFVLELSEGWSITVAPASAVVDEFWRFWDALGGVYGGDHFVVFEEPEGEEP